MICEYVYGEEVGTLKFEGYSAYWTVSESSDRTNCQFLCLSAFHVRRYIQSLLQKFAYLDLVYIFS